MYERPFGVDLPGVSRLYSTSLHSHASSWGCTRDGMSGMRSSPSDQRAFVLCVCGGRNYSDKLRVFAVLDHLHATRPIAQIVHGGAAGADFLAGEWAAARGVPVKVFPADWKAHGRSAGPRRNGQMVAYGLSRLVAFPGGSGTDDMVRQCVTSDIEVMVVS